jgi:small-conductance mechanosensitive channel
MSSGLLTATLSEGGEDIWRLTSAVAIIAGVNIVRRCVLYGYHHVIERCDYNQRQQWIVENSVASIFLVIMAIVCIKAGQIVLSRDWVEQITSAMVVGIGFGLQSTIQDVVYGYIRRSNKYVMTAGQLLEVTPYNTAVTGTIDTMTLNTFTFRCDDGSMYVLPWTSLKSFRVVHPGKRLQT